MTHKSIPIEVPAKPGQILGMSATQFLRDYWQKQPLLIRGAFPQLHNAIAPEDLAGLSCEEGALSRLVLHDPKGDRWTLRNGPFNETDFAKLPKTHWTLLVQDVDKWDQDVAAVLDHFDFVPSWRVDDVMISYATDGGGVGAHVDQYDVFLIQARGRRRWQINENAHAPTVFREDTELKLLREFSPTHDWLLEAGDVLYLPPGVAHEGVAVGECLTFSVGMRAPAQAELLLDFAEFLAEPLGEQARYTDVDLRLTRDAHEIDAAALTRVRAALPHFSNVDNATLLGWFGGFITRYRAAHEAAPVARPIGAAQLTRRLPTARIVRNPFSRFAWARVGRGAWLFVAGERFSCSRTLAQTLCASREIEGKTLLPTAGATGIPTLAALIDSGHLRLTRAPRRRIRAL